ncbi:MAG: fatty acid desaturase [Granulosicoccus sp.]|nr:fatty acid desaturase [Granulosicoccus sp.]
MSTNLNSLAVPSEVQPFPPLSEASRGLKIRWYRCPIAHERLRELSRRTDRQGWIQAGGHFLLYLIVAAITWACWSMQQWWAMVVALWFLGVVASYFKGTATHELGHGTVFRTRSLNRFFLYTFSMISWWDPFDYATSHTYHHRYTTHPNADRENLLPLEPSLRPWMLVQLLTFNLFTRPGRNFSKGGFIWTVYLTGRSALALPPGHHHIPSQEWRKTLHEDQPQAFKQSMQWSRLLLVFHASVLLIAIVSGFWILPLILTLPSYIANLLSYLTGTTQHCGLQQNVTDFRKNTRSIRLNPMLAFLYWHMNWHTEHHMYAGVPCYNLKALAQELKTDMPEPKSLLGAWIEMRQIWKRQQSDPDYCHEVAVPKPSENSEPDDVDGQLVNSIGELAPTGLRQL